MSSVITFDCIRGTVTALASDNIPLIDWWHLNCQRVIEIRTHFSAIQRTAFLWDYCDREDLGNFDWMENCAHWTHQWGAWQYCPRTVIWWYDHLNMYSIFYLGHMYLINRSSPINTCKCLQDRGGPYLNKYKCYQLLQHENVCMFLGTSFPGGELMHSYSLLYLCLLHCS